MKRLWPHKKIAIVTHNSRFHADDVFAVATLLLYLKKDYDEVNVVRTRDEDKIKEADYVLDVGGIYDFHKNRLDHHQAGGADKRENDIPYATFGLAWKHFGLELCSENQKVWKIVDEKLVQPVDANDIGVNIYKNLFNEIYPYTIDLIIKTFYSTWQEKDNFDEKFKDAVSFATHIIKREIKIAEAEFLAEEVVLKSYKSSGDKRIILLDKKYPFHETLDDFKDVMYVLYPKEERRVWYVEAAKVTPKGFEQRNPFPSAWRGKVDSELTKVTGVPDATFCHNNGFLAVAKSKEGAIKLANLALEK